MQGVQESLHSDIAALDSRFEDMPLLLCSLSSLSRGSSSLSSVLTLSAQPSPGFLTTSTQSSRLQCRLQSSTRTSRSTHHHLLHHRWIDLLGNSCQRGRWSFGVLGSRGSSWTSHGDHLLFASACYSCYICVELFVLHCTFVYYLASICGLNLNLVCNV